MTDKDVLNDYLDTHKGSPTVFIQQDDIQKVKADLTSSSI
jgi:hypothetical protein